MKFPEHSKLFERLTIRIIIYIYVYNNYILDWSRTTVFVIIFILIINYYHKQYNIKIFTFAH